jgi:hypothetical protein
MVSSRLTLVVPALFAAAGMPLLARIWQIREAQTGRSEPFPRLDRVTGGRLLSYRWHVHTLNTGAVALMEHRARPGVHAGTAGGRAGLLQTLVLELDVEPGPGLLPVPLDGAGGNL